MRHTVEMLWLAWQTHAEPFDAAVLTCAAIAWLAIVGSALVRSIGRGCARVKKAIASLGSPDWLNEGNVRPRW